jgi:hypothetical protein
MMWDVTPCSLHDGYQGFEEIYSLQLQEFPLCREVAWSSATSIPVYQTTRSYVRYCRYLTMLRILWWSHVPFLHDAFYFWIPPSPPNLPSLSHLAGSSLPEAVISVSLSAAYSYCFSVSFSLPWFNNVSTKGASQANLFSDARSKAVCWSWPVGILLACRVELLSPLYVAHSRGSLPSWGRVTWGFVRSVVGYGHHHLAACHGMLHEPARWPTRPRRRCEPATCRMAREGPELCRRYQLTRDQGCWAAPRKSAVQASSARSDHDLAVESNPRSGGYLRTIVSSATSVLVAMWLVFENELFVSCMVFVVPAWVVYA